MWTNVKQYLKSVRSSHNIMNTNSPCVVVEWLTLLVRIREVPASNIGQETGYLKVL
jgi:hypothetical protein